MSYFWEGQKCCMFDDAKKNGINKRSNAVPDINSVDSHAAFYNEVQWIATHFL